MKLVRNLPPWHDALLFSISGTRFLYAQSHRHGWTYQGLYLPSHGPRGGAKWWGKEIIGRKSTYSVPGIHRGVFIETFSLYVLGGREYCKSHVTNPSSVQGCTACIGLYIDCPKSGPQADPPTFCRTIAYTVMGLRNQNDTARQVEGPARHINRLDSPPSRWCKWPSFHDGRRQQIGKRRRSSDGRTPDLSRRSLRRTLSVWNINTCTEMAMKGHERCTACETLGGDTSSMVRCNYDQPLELSRKGPLSGRWPWSNSRVFIASGTEPTPIKVTVCWCQATAIFWNACHNETNQRESYIEGTVGVTRGLFTWIDCWAVEVSRVLYCSIQAKPPSQ